MIYNENNVPTPVYVVDERLLKKNLEKLKTVKDKTECKILLALKGFAMYELFPLIGKYLDGATASSLHEARLGKEEMGKEVHIFAPAYSDIEFDNILKYSDHIVFNTPNQVYRYAKIAKDNNKECALRINPEYSEINTKIYDPCALYSRLGTTYENFDEKVMEYLDGIHFHTMCEQNSDVLWRTILNIEKKFGKYLKEVSWINFGGGHHITRKDYDIKKLVSTINYVKEKYNVQVYLEPGEAVVLNTGILISQVLDIVNNKIDIAILDTSASCHMPDVIEMPYTPSVIGANSSFGKKFNYRLGGLTCLAGDVIGDYSFNEELKPGDRIVFEDMAHYTMVKNNTFNGIKLPNIAIQNDDGIKVVKSFGYKDFKRRL